MGPQSLVGVGLVLLVVLWWLVGSAKSQMDYLLLLNSPWYGQYAHVGLTLILIAALHRQMPAIVLAQPRLSAAWYASALVLAAVLVGVHRGTVERQFDDRLPLPASWNDLEERRRFQFVLLVRAEFISQQRRAWEALDRAGSIAQERGWSRGTIQQALGTVPGPYERFDMLTFLRAPRTGGAVNEDAIRTTLGPLFVQPFVVDTREFDFQYKAPPETQPGNTK